MKLQGERLYLRALDINDAEGNYPNWLNDPIVYKYNSHGSVHYTKAMAIEYIQSVTDNSTCQVFAICLNESNQHIGNISLQAISKKDKSAEFAILLGETSYMGKGYAQEASQLLLEYGFKNLQLQRIHCGTSEDNLPMQKLALSLGMQQVGVQEKKLLKNDILRDIYLYGITK